MSPARKPRKTLDEVATGFVFGIAEGTDEPSETPSENVDDNEGAEGSVEKQPAKPTQPAETTEKQSKGNLMSRLMEAPEKEATVRVTVDLPKSMHQKLSMLCARTGKKKVEIIRMLLDEALNEVGE